MSAPIFLKIIFINTFFRIQIFPEMFWKLYEKVAKMLKIIISNGPCNKNQLINLVVVPLFVYWSENFFTPSILVTLEPLFLNNEVGEVSNYPKIINQKSKKKEIELNNVVEKCLEEKFFLRNKSKDFILFSKNFLTEFILEVYQYRGVLEIFMQNMKILGE